MSGTRLFFAACLLVSAALLVVAGAAALPGRPVPLDAAAGARLWRAYGCEACHSLYGQGAAYAPDLTAVHDRRGPDDLRQLLAAEPHSRQRGMPALSLPTDEAGALLAFLRWAARQPTGWPSMPGDPAP